MRSTATWRRYLDATREAQKKFKQRVLIDPFCGPGCIQVEGENFTRDGGAIVAYRQSLRSGAPFTKLLVGDIDSSRVHANELRLRAAGAAVQSFVGPAEQTVGEMAKAVPFGALALAYIDPYNLEFLSFSIIERLAKLQYVDFAVHFSLMDLTRISTWSWTPSGTALAMRCRVGALPYRPMNCPSRDCPPGSSARGVRLLEP